MKLLPRIILMFACAGIWGAFTPAMAADAQGKVKKDLFLKGDAKCTECHDDADSPEALAIGKTRHGVTADKRNPTCTSCHGESEEHIKKAGSADKGKAPKVEVGYTKKNPATAEQRNEKCLTCHQGGKHVFWQSSAHGSNDVACSSCHKIHAAHDTVRDKRAQADVCYSCHKEQRAQMNRVSHHPVPEGKMACSSCHDAHGNNPKALAKHSVNETCYSCHMEKRGPFVHNHEPVSEDCSICHNPHGSNIANLLKARPPMLCTQCHGPDSHPSAPPSLPRGSSSLTVNSSNNIMGTVGRGCLNCHTNIHGGNSTQSNVTAERFRR